MEYYIDTDPGYGNATSIPITPGVDISRDFTVNLASQTAGIHAVGIRARDAMGHWSQTYLHSFLVANNAIAATVVATEYFIDEDPGIGKATTLSTFSSRDESLNYVIPLNELTKGFHVLGTRAKDNLGKWSHTMLHSFLLNEDNVAMPISALQYYFTGDGASDSVYTYQLPEPSVMVDLDFSANLSQLAANREYTIHIWALNTKGTTSGAHTKKIKVCSSEVATAGFDFIPIGMQVSFSDSSRGADTYRWDFGDGHIDSVSNPVHTYAAGGSYTVRQIVSNFCNSDTVEKVVPVVSLQSVHTNAGGNTGHVTVTITGAGFNNQTEVKLIKDGVEISGINNSTTDNGNLLNATFDLAGKPVGEWNLQANNGSNSAVLNNVFTIEKGVEPNITIDVVGRTTFRAGRPEKFTIKYTNTGNVDVYTVPISLVYPKGVEVNLQNELIKLSGNYGFDTFNEDSLSLTIPLGDSVLLPLIVPVIYANGSGEIKISLTAPDMQAIPFTVLVNRPVYDLVSRNSNTPPGQNEGGDDGCLATHIGAGLVAAGGITSAAAMAGVNMCVIPLTISVGSIGVSVEGMAQAAKSESTTGWLKGLVTSTSSFVLAGFGGIVSLGGCVVVGSDAFILGGIGLGLSGLGAVISYVDYQNNPACWRQVKKVVLSLNSLASFDPNEKVGPTGNTISNYHQGAAPFNYTIYFENKNTATAPAQEVIIVDTLDMSKFDVSTFQLQSFGYGNSPKTYIPVGLSEYFSIDTLRRAGKPDLLVKTDAKLDTAKGILTWRFISLDPKTRELTDDPLDGFLPPNITSPQGEGFVSYSIKPKAGLPHGTEIRNKASIYFDNNEPIVTNEFLNTLDKISPESAVSASPSEVNDTTFIVQWNGSDNGSGIRSYDVYYKVNNGEYRLWQYDVSSTQDSFVGQQDSVYSFFSVSKDYAGNIESTKNSAERTVTVKILKPEPPATETSQNIILIYPNPTQDRLNVKFKEPQLNNIKWRLTDAIGRVVLLNENQIISGDIFSIDVSRLPKGMYFLGITGASFNKHLKFVKQ